jgi:hypothetical protein
MKLEGGMKVMYKCEVAWMPLISGFGVARGLL